MGVDRLHPHSPHLQLRAGTRQLPAAVTVWYPLQLRVASRNSCPSAGLEPVHEGPA